MINTGVNEGALNDWIRKNDRLVIIGIIVIFAVVIALSIGIALKEHFSNYSNTLSDSKKNTITVGAVVLGIVICIVLFRRIKH